MDKGLNIWKFVIILFLILVSFYALRINYKRGLPQSMQTLSQLTSLYKGHLVSDNVGPVPNVFSWGYNRHICFDPSNKAWWIFYYRVNKNKGHSGFVVYKFSKDNGKTWSDEIFISLGEEQSADFTIDCSPPYISIAYSRIDQNDVIWKKGKMSKDSINWSNPIVAMMGERSYTRVAPSIIYYKGIPVVATRDQSEEGSINGHKRAHVAIAKDHDGRKWNNTVTIFDDSLNDDSLNKKVSEGYFSTPSLGIIKNELYALINIGEDFYLSKYLGDNKWTMPSLTPRFNYEGRLGWSTVTDVEGNLHVFYKERGSNLIRHAILNGTLWAFENIFALTDNRQISISVDKDNNLYLWSFENIDVIANDRQISVSIDKDNNLYLVGGNNITIVTFMEGKTIKRKASLKDTDAVISYTNTAQFLFNDMLGIAWAQGDMVNPTIWFACLKKVKTESGLDLKECK